MVTATPTRQTRSATTDADTLACEREAFLLRLAESLHRAGVSAPRLERAVARCAHTLETEVAIFAVPTGLTIGFGPVETQRMRMIRVDPGSVALFRVRLLDGVVRALVEEGVPLEAAAERLEQAIDAPMPFGARTSIAAFGLVGAGAGLLFGGAISEVAVAACASLLVGLVIVLGARDPRRAPLLEFAGGFVAALAIGLVARFVIPLNEPTTLIASILVLLPGLSLTVSMNELATRHLTAGTTRLMGAAMSLVALGFGVAMATAITRPIESSVVLDALPPLDGRFIFVGVPILALALVVLFQARKRDTPWVVAAVALGFGGATAGAMLVGPQLGASIGAFLVGITGNAMNRLRSTPISLIVLPGLMAIVPGALGFTGFAAMLDEDVTGGIGALFDTVVVAGAIVAGLLLAGVALPVRRDL